MFGYLDCFSGVSGDKLLGAIVDAGVPVEVLVERLSALAIGGYEVSATKVSRGSLTGTLVTVAVTEEQPPRHLGDIERILADSPLEARVRERALKTFRLLAEVEAGVHGTTVSEVHFHEVGAVDSIVDVVGTAIGLAELGVDELWASPVCTGFGTVETSHGTLPVPAPATSAILQGVPTASGPVEGELTTPTGAALLQAYGTRYEPMPAAIITAQGYGAGSRELPGVPNLLRLRIGELAEHDVPAAATPDTGTETIVVLETAIDHVSAEDLATALEHQLEAGALDAWQAPIVMKKGRLGAALTVLCEPQDADRLVELLMADTGTLGVRRTPTQRTVAGRRADTLETSLGRVRVKVAEAAGVTQVRPEHDDVAEVSRRTGLAIKDVAARLSAEVSRASQVREVEAAIADTEQADPALQPELPLAPEETPPDKEAAISQDAPVPVEPSSPPPAEAHETE
jgi:pyridinium-3,5-bisthiocarboxylic acid mononucleotide nickel chelatase